MVFPLESGSFRVKEKSQEKRKWMDEVNYSALLLRPALDEHQRSLSLYINESYLTVTSSECMWLFLKSPFSILPELRGLTAF